MKRKFRILSMSLFLSSCVLFSSCIGSFGLFNKLLSWNKTVGDKFINELVFIAFCIIPVYEISWMADIVVFNSIEFWTGSNPVAEGKVQKIEGQNGNYTVETTKNGYHIEKEGVSESVDLKFNESEKVWSVEANGESTPLLKVVNAEEVVMFLPDGSEMNVSLNEAGVLAYKQVVTNGTFFAAR